MAFWSTQFHRSDADSALNARITGFQDDLVQLQVVLGNTSTQNTLVYDVSKLKQDFTNLSKQEGPQGLPGPRGPRGYSWLSMGKDPEDEDGVDGDFYLNASNYNVFKKISGSWVRFGHIKGDPGLKGDTGQTGAAGIQGVPGPSNPFYLLPYIAQEAYYFVYIHPSRFELLDKPRKSNFRATHILDLTGKKIRTPTMTLSKDTDKNFYVTLNRVPITVTERFENMFSANKSFAIFQVAEVNNPNPNQLFFTPFSIDSVGSFPRDGLKMTIANNQIVLHKFTSSASDDVFSTTQSTVIQPLRRALETLVTQISTIAGTKFVLSLSRDSNGIFTVYLNSIKLFSHTDTRPFRRISQQTGQIEQADYSIGSASFTNDTTMNLYCQLHFTKSLSENMIIKIHSELMEHYSI